MRLLAVKLMLTVLSVLVVLGAVEIVLSTYYPEEYMRMPERQPDDLFLEVLHRPSQTPGLAFELAPNRQKKTQAGAGWVRTNSSGMRDDEPRAMEDQSAARVVVLGDSFTFGFRVPGGACYPSVLERRLNDELWRERGVDVLNFGVSGYATREEALVLEHKAMRWRPDLIIIGYVLNDPEIDPVQPLTRYFQEPAWWQHFDLLRRLAKVKHQWEINRRGGGDYYRYLHSPEHRRWKSVVAAFGDIQAAAASADVPVLVVIFPESRRDVPWSEYAYLDIHEQVAQAAREHGFEVLDLYEAFSRYEPRTLMVRRRDPHPSTFGHEVAANAIYDWIASVFPGQS